ALTLHHIAADGWSQGILVREIAAFYRGVPLAELPIQYADFALWQRQWLCGETLAQEIDWWRLRLAGAPEEIPLPTDRPRTAAPSNQGDRCRAALSQAVELRRLCREQQATLFMVLLAAFATLLSRWSGEEDLVVGSPIANRNRVETEGLIGFFVNTLPLRVNLAGQLPFAGLLASVREGTLAAYGHQDLPFEKLVEALQPARHLGRTPLFQVTLTLQNAPFAAVELPGLSLSPLPLDTGTAMFDLSLSLTEGTGELALEYRTDLFERTTALRLLEHFRVLLDAAAEDPELPLQEIALLTAAEAHQLLEWSPPLPEPAGPATVHRLLEAQAARSPEAVALVASGDGGELTYRELAVRVDALALRLRALGVGPEVRVALCARRSPASIIALLAVVRAGGAYVPLDPASPRRRLELLLEDSGARLLLADRDLAERLPPEHPPVLWLDEPLPPQPEPGPWRELAAESEPGGENLAYLIYTSGSTGRPKAVAVEHRSLAAHVRSTAAEYALGPGDRVLQFAALFFDVSVEEIFSCLERGATLVLASDRPAEAPSAFLAACHAAGVTVLNLPTAFWHQLAAALDAEGLALPPTLRLVIIGGEQALPAALAAWRRRVPPGVRLINAYGPTEATIGATFWEDRPETTPDPVPIGRPFSHARALVLDRGLRPVPVGVAGELCL
ncbi:MAG TPA: AMP-binding protein, partial [Thermoanaerobaculia bacterium]|nr:AMP-binding protein [Thermoanaerobaculia bacterium]